MKRINNKGFAISTIIYGTLIMAVMIVMILLSTMSFSNKSTKDLSKQIESDLNGIMASEEEEEEGPGISPTPQPCTAIVNTKAIVIGDKDGITDTPISKVLSDSGIKVVYTMTDCFTCSAAGAMDLVAQQKIKDTVEKYGDENVIIVLGQLDEEAAELSAETVTKGDPTFAGPLTGVELGVRVYHIFDQELRSAIDEEAWDTAFGDVIEVDGIADVVKQVRDRDKRCT